jgi:hypothetical protein
LGLTQVEGCTNGRNVRCEYGGCNFGHVQFAFFAVAP